MGSFQATEGWFWDGTDSISIDLTSRHLYHPGVLSFYTFCIIT